MAKKKGGDSSNTDGFIGLLILLAIIGLVIKYFNQVMIVVAVIAAIVICVQLFNFFKENASERTEKGPKE